MTYIGIEIKYQKSVYASHVSLKHKVETGCKELWWRISVEKGEKELAHHYQETLI